jgi:CshA-type fibril repeat protein
LTNDAAATGATLMPDTVLLCDVGETSPSCTQTIVTISGVGTYSVDDKGVMTFAPEASYTGTPAPLPYTVKDNLGQVASSTYTPSVIPPEPPTATPDTTSGMQGRTQVIDLLANDFAGTLLSLDPASVRLCGPDEALPTCTQTVVTIAGVGTYSIDTTGLMTFVPEPGFVGTPAPLTYLVYDNIGQMASSTYTPTVIAPPPPVDESSPAPAPLTPVASVLPMTRISITTTASRPRLRVYQKTVIKLRVRNTGGTAARSATAWAPIPKGFRVVQRNGGTVRGRFITFQLGDIPVRGTRVRTFTLIATRAGNGHAVPVMGRSAGSNVRPVKDPTKLRVVGGPARTPNVTG